MTIHPQKLRLTLVIGAGLLVTGVIYAAIALELWVGTSDHIGLRNGPATLTARTLKTPVGETTGPWHYHPGYVYNAKQKRCPPFGFGVGPMQNRTFLVAGKP
jgi:hypothetical protein